MTGPRNGALPYRLREFFQENPDEELTKRNACDKFDCRIEALERALMYLRVVGELEYVSVIRARAKGRAR